MGSFCPRRRFLTRALVNPFHRVLLSKNQFWVSRWRCPFLLLRPAPRREELGKSGELRPETGKLKDGAVVPEAWVRSASRPYRLVFDLGALFYLCALCVL